MVRTDRLIEELWADQAVGTARNVLQTGDAAKAEQVFRADLKQFPRNGWGLFGLEQSLRAQGRNQLADTVNRQLEETWKRADVRLDLTAF